MINNNSIKFVSLEELSVSLFVSKVSMILGIRFFIISYIFEKIITILINLEKTSFKQNLERFKMNYHFKYIMNR